ncbi:MAG TPA: extracellular solute-binding protein, partial [Clostridia bacterium]
MIKKLLSGVMACTLALSLVACEEYNADYDLGTDSDTVDDSGSSNSSSGSGSSTSTIDSSTPKDTQKDATNKTDMKGEISFWHFNRDEAPKILDAFQKTHPNIKVKLTVVSDRDQQYVNKLTAAVKSGSGVPDVFTAESAFIKRVVDMEGAWDDLTDKAAPFKNDFVPYTLQVGTDKNGRIRALSHQITAGGIGYKRSVAKKYLGTDDSAQIAKYFTSEEKMLEAGKKIKEASGGKVSLFPGWEELVKIYLGGRREPWIKDNKLVIDQKMIDLIDFAKKLKDNGYEKELKQWDPAWAASIADNETALAYCVPTWGIPYVIAPNDRKAVDGGRWGIVEGPCPYFWGGTWYGVYSKSQKKDLAWEFVKWFTTDKEHLKAWNKDTGDIPSSISV